jgi:hypothetical protein
MYLLKLTMLLSIILVILSPARFILKHNPSVMSTMCIHFMQPYNTHTHIHTPFSLN